VATKKPRRRGGASCSGRGPRRSPCSLKMFLIENPSPRNLLQGRSQTQSISTRGPVGFAAEVDEDVRFRGGASKQSPQATAACSRVSSELTRRTPKPLLSTTMRIEVCCGTPFSTASVSARLWQGVPARVGVRRRATNATSTARRCSPCFCFIDSRAEHSSLPKAARSAVG
jgi:hypothetical protein